MSIIGQIAVESAQNLPLLLTIGVGIEFLKRGDWLLFLLVLLIGAALSALVIEGTEVYLWNGFEPSVNGFLWNLVGFSLPTALIIWLMFRFHITVPVAIALLIVVTVVVTTGQITVGGGEVSLTGMSHAVALSLGGLAAIVCIAWQINVEEQSLLMVAGLWFLTNLVFSILIWIVDYSEILNFG